jgi:hypothetical protein
MEQGERRMTKEELRKEVKEWIDNRYKHEVLGKRVQMFFTYWELLCSIVDFAEPREKQIQIDAEQIRALQKQNGELTDRVRELEAQIEKMKCCGNCRNVTANPVKGTLVYSCGKTRNNINFFKACDKWEIKEK